jgi:predicted dinucleotide-utilizing enzyme
VTPVNLIGRGGIGGQVAGWLSSASGYRLQSVIERGMVDWPTAPLTIDAAGPAALREHGERLLAEGELWTVGAAALIDPAFAARLRNVSADSGHRLRLFTAWVTGPSLCPAGYPARLEVHQSAPGLAPAPGEVFAGPLADAAERFPDHLNTATAAALVGPGIEATAVRLTCTPAGSPHVLRARFQMPGATIETRVRLDVASGEPHPVAAAIIAALQSRGGWLHYS